MDKKTISKSSQYIDSLVKGLLEIRGYSEDDSTQYKKTKKEITFVLKVILKNRKLISKLKNPY